MKGTVTAINYITGFAAVETEGGITVFELIGGCEIEKGDIISGSLESVGGETFFNKTQGEEIDVYVQGFHCTPESAQQLMS